MICHSYLVSISPTPRCHFDPLEKSLRPHHPQKETGDREEREDPIFLDLKTW